MVGGAGTITTMTAAFMEDFTEAEHFMAAVAFMEAPWVDSTLAAAFTEEPLVVAFTAVEDFTEAAAATDNV